ncbi:MAG: DUF6597 domain-containing transcriptional factor [Candidatus Moraniibacteriota bacterium]|jgi:AraC-like DNA-binding protein
MITQLIEFKPNSNLQKYIDAFWFSRNTLGEVINWPVVPDGCSDIIFYLNNSKKLEGVNDTFVTGIMEEAQLIPIPSGMEFFGIRFKPGILFYLLGTDMSKLTNSMIELRKLNEDIYKKLSIDIFAENDEIVSIITPLLENIFEEHELNDDFLHALIDLTDNPNMMIDKLSSIYGLSSKNLERVFSKKMGLTPKKFARIMRFQKAHKKISKEGLENLITVALSSGYFDQAHFNRDYKKLTGNNPSNETMSILYN